jgi:hypothetical protein
VELGRPPPERRDRELAEARRAENGEDKETSGTWHVHTESSAEMAAAIPIERARALGISLGALDEYCCGTDSGQVGRVLVIAVYPSTRPHPPGGALLGV